MSARGHILAIEISNPSAGGGSVAIGRLVDGGVEGLSVEPVRASGFGAKSGGFGGHDDDLMPAIDRLVKRTGIDARKSLALVAVSAGPGGYTSLRVACAAGKMIACAARNDHEPARCVAVPTALAVLESVPADIRAGAVAVALAGKGDSAWIECFVVGAPAQPGSLMSAGDVPRLVERATTTIVADRFFPDAFRSAAMASGIRIIEPVFDAAACARVGARLPSIAPAELVPIYPREPDAVTLWRSRRSGG